jgi:hypothetical protein
MNPPTHLELKRVRAERKLAHLNSLIEAGHLGWPTYWRLNWVCRKIEKLDKALGPKLTPSYPETELWWKKYLASKIKTKPDLAWHRKALAEHRRWKDFQAGWLKCALECHSQVTTHPADIEKAYQAFRAQEAVAGE